MAEIDVEPMDDDAFDRAAVKAVFEQAALRGWGSVSLAEAALDAGLDLPRLRGRFTSLSGILIAFGRLADQAALSGLSVAATPRERLFDMLMNRLDVLQAHRGGVEALLLSLRTDPATALLLYSATTRSMRWLLDAAGVPVGGILGAIRVHGLTALWLYALRAWETDESADLARTMKAVDQGLDRAMQAERSLPLQPEQPSPPPMPEPPDPANV